MWKVSNGSCAEVISFRLGRREAGFVGVDPLYATNRCCHWARTTWGRQGFIWLHGPFIIVSSVIRGFSVLLFIAMTATGPKFSAFQLDLILIIIGWHQQTL